MTDARIGYGSKYIIDGTEVGEVIEITPGEATTERVQATHMQSPGRRHEYIPGMIDSGEASFQINWIPGNATDTLLRGLLASGAIEEHTIVFPNGVTVTFDAAVTGFSKVLPIEDRMTATVTVAVSGDETWGAESAPTNTVLPAISGLLEVGETLTAYPGVWTGAPTFTYQWQNEGANIVGATSQTYVLQAGDSGDNIRVIVTGTNTAGNASATSPATDAIAA